MACYGRACALTMTGITVPSPLYRCPIWLHPPCAHSNLTAVNATILHSGIKTADERPRRFAGDHASRTGARGELDRYGRSVGLGQSEEVKRRKSASASTASTSSLAPRT